MAAPPEQRQSICEHEAVRLSLDNLMTFPWIRDAVDAGHFTLHGCLFDIRSGVLERLGEDGVFRPDSGLQSDAYIPAWPRQKRGAAAKVPRMRSLARNYG